MKRRSLWIVVAALVVALGGAGAAYAAAGSGVDGAPTKATSTASAARTAVSDQPRGFGACGRLFTDPAARDAMWELRAEHHAEMRAWWEQYGSDPSSAAAQSALDELRTEHRNDMRSLLEEYGVDEALRNGGGPLGGAGCGAGCGPGVAGGGQGMGRGMMRLY